MWLKLKVQQVFIKSISNSYISSFYNYLVILVPIETIFSMRMDGMQTVLSIGAVAAFIMHSCALYLFWKHRRKYTDKIQYILLFNLCFIEWLFPLITAWSIVLPIPSSIKNRLVIFLISMITLGIYAISLYLVIHRFLQVFLNIRYEVYWNIKKTHILLIVTWILVETYATFAAIIFSDKLIYMFNLGYFLVPCVIYIGEAGNYSLSSIVSSNWTTK